VHEKIDAKVLIKNIEVLIKDIDLSPNIGLDSPKFAGRQ